MKRTLAEIKKQLLEMKTLDQEMRNQNPIDWDKLTKIDQQNTEKLNTIVNEYGLIDIRRFGEDGSAAAWILVQHAPKSEIAFMQQYLDLMKASPEKIKLKNIAYLEDRVNMYKDLPQTYGTQVISNEKGEMVFYKIFDLTTIDTQRAKMGLYPIREYASKFSPSVQLPNSY